MNNQDAISNHTTPEDAEQASNTTTADDLPESSDNLTTASLPPKPNKLTMHDALGPSDVHTTNTQAQTSDKAAICDVPSTSGDLTISVTLQTANDATANIITCNIPTTAIAPPVEADIIPIHDPATAWSTPALENQPTDARELATILESLHTYFHGRVDANDIQALTFCLHHLFCCSARLYQNILPELTASTSHQTWQAGQERDILATYCIWEQLQTIGSLFERIESLCYLLNSTIPIILDTLENTCRARGLRAPTTSDQVSQSAQSDDIPLQSAFADLNERLCTWQQSNAQRPSFAHLFADLQTIISTLVQVDTAFNLLQEHTNAIFGKILPQFLSIVTTDDESATILLLDLMQKADELQFYMRVQLEPLYMLLQQQI